MAEHFPFCGFGLFIIFFFPISARNGRSHGRQRPPVRQDLSGPEGGGGEEGRGGVGWVGRVGGRAGGHACMHVQPCVQAHGHGVHLHVTSTAGRKGWCVRPKDSCRA